MKVLSLCTEKGSEVSAFIDRGHKVDTVGICGDVTYLIDVREFNPDKQYDFVFACPPCTEFSKGSWRLGKFCNRKPDTSILIACMKLIDVIEPIFWIIENPVGMMRHYLGNPGTVLPGSTIQYADFGNQFTKKEDFWGIFPDISHRKTPNPNPIPFQMVGNGKNQKWKRSIIPYNISLALCLEMERLI